MPAGDRTGPFGAGPMSGRAMGYCAGFPVPGCANPAWGGGFGRGWGCGRGFWRLARRGRWGAMPYATGYPAWGPYGYAYSYGYPLAAAPYPAVPYPWVW